MCLLLVREQESRARLDLVQDPNDTLPDAEPSQIQPWWLRTPVKCILLVLATLLSYVVRHGFLATVWQTILGTDYNTKLVHLQSKASQPFFWGNASCVQR